MSQSIPAQETQWSDGCVKQLVEKCLALGLIMRRHQHNEFNHPVITLQPTRMRRADFDSLCQLQLLWNEAVDNTARDFAYLRDALHETAISDTGFTGRLVHILQAVYLGPEPYQKLMLGIFRTDYMLSKGETLEAASGGEGGGGEGVAAWKNVEINTISCSFAGLSPLVTSFHQHIDAYQRALRGHHVKDDKNSPGHGCGGISRNNNSGGEGSDLELVRSVSKTMVPEALSAAVSAWSSQTAFDSTSPLYGRSYAEQQGWSLQRPIVLVVVQENERNTSDQYALQIELLEAHGILSFRRTLQELHNDMKLHFVPGEPPLAILDGCYPVAVAYFRSTYVPEDLPTEATWDTRLAIERSSAIKCPSIPYHLLTFKKLQQLFCDVENVLMPIAFHGDAVKAHRLQLHFVPQYSLNPVEVDEATVQRIIDDAVRHPDRFVLKPQLEGGGNLIFGEGMRAALRTTREEDPVAYSRIRREYILMSRINNSAHTGALLVDGNVVQMKDNLCSELGIFGVILGDGKADSRLRNACAGYIVRTKPADVEGGGVMAGIAALDSLALV